MSPSASQSIPYGATASRPDWSDLPLAVRERVEEQLDSPVVAAANQRSGYTQGFASRLVTADGQRIFLKAASDQDGGGVLADCYRAEAHVVPHLPDELPVPKLQWTVEADGWVVVCFEDVPGQPPNRPWEAKQLAAALACLTPVSELLSPGPADLVVPAAEDWLREEFGAWSRLAAGDDRSGSLPTGRIEELATLERGVFDAIRGESVVHADLRDDNLIVGDDGTIWLCDWNWPCRAAPWFDLVTLLIPAYDDGYNADALLAAHPLGAGVDPEHIDALLAALSGYYTEVSGRPTLSMSPHLRTVQAAYAEASLAWLAVRRGWLS